MNCDPIKAKTLGKANGIKSQKQNAKAKTKVKNGYILAMFKVLA